MKSLNRKLANIFFMIVATCFIGINPVIADQINFVDKDYQPGDTLDAADLTDTFNEIKSVVNKNDGKSTLNDLSCANGQVAKWDGSAWVCADDIDTDTLLTLSCTNGQVAKWNGSAWACADITTVQSYTKYYSGSFFDPGSNVSSIQRHISDAYSYSISVVTGQYFNMPLDLPIGATIIELTCYNYDNDATNDIGVMGQYIFTNTAGATSFDPSFSGSIPATTSASTTINSATSTGSLPIENSNAYRIYVYTGSFGGSINIRFYGCEVTYTK
jgi:hypothetical protein